MKKLRYLYTLITVVLLSTVIYSCDDSSMIISEDGDSVEIPSNGETIKTTFTVGISAPNVSGDLDVATRAGGDNANIEYAKPENGGRFQNLIVVLTGDTTVSRSNKEKIYGVKCTSWNDNIGVKEHKEIFPDLTVSKSNVGKQKFHVYVFGNVGKEHYDKISGEAASKVNSLSYLGDWANLKNYCRDASISFNDVYKIDFTPGLKYDIKYGTNNGTTSTVTSTGMPVNNKAEATLATGNTEFNVELKRVCARIQVSFRNFTGTYKQYPGGSPAENDIYVDKFEIPSFLTKTTKYASWSSSPSSNSLSNFDLSTLINNAHYKIENGNSVTFSMYVFETTRNSECTYNLKLDRGKSLGLKTTKIEYDNAYVIWNNKYKHTISSDGTNIGVTEQQYSDIIPFEENVFWKFEEPGNDNPKVNNDYMAKSLVVSSDGSVTEGGYFQHQDDVSDKRDAGIYDIKSALVSGTTPKNKDNQYIQLTIDGKSSNDQQSYYTINLLNSKHANTSALGLGWINHIPYDYYNASYWAKFSQWFGGDDAEGYFYLTVDNGELKRKISPIGVGAVGLEYEWTLYAKYILRNDDTKDGNNQRNNYLKFKKEGVSETVKTISRNNSYELDFSVMPNYDTKQEFLVNCVRKQNVLDWKEVEK